MLRKRNIRSLTSKDCNDINNILQQLDGFYQKSSQPIKRINLLDILDKKIYIN